MKNSKKKDGAEFWWILTLTLSAGCLVGTFIYLSAQYFCEPGQCPSVISFFDSEVIADDKNFPLVGFIDGNKITEIELKERNHGEKIVVEKTKRFKSFSKFDDSLKKKTTMNLGLANSPNLHDQYQPIADKIISYIKDGPAKGQAYERLAYVADTFGHRMVGSKALDQTIDYFVHTLQKEGLDNVHKEVVKNLPNWVRGVERAILISPRNVSMKILGLGSTVPTPEEGLCAEAVVVTSFDELDRLGASVKGKIVVYNQPWVNYGVSGRYRVNGASRASKYGAVATLIRSAASHSVYTPHTGMQSYDPGVTPIPAACLTVEDAEMLYRIQKRGQNLKICLIITSKTQGVVDSYNTVAEIKGSTFPNEIVMIGGHLDSWDVGTGAMDDGGGVIISWQALSVIKALGLKPKRTIRAVFWTAEEQGYLGCSYYYNEHKNMANETYRFVYESDAGAFKPDGLCFNGSVEAWQIMQQVMNLLKPIRADRLRPAFEVGDVEPWKRDGVPAAKLDPFGTQDYYFTFHHTEADNVIVFKPSDLDYSSILTAVVAYVVADMDKPLPRRNENVEFSSFS